MVRKSDTTPDLTVSLAMSDPECIVKSFNVNISFIKEKN